MQKSDCRSIGKAFDDNWGLDDPTGKSHEEFTEIISQIELKIKPNRPTKNQLEVLTMLSNNNWNTAVCYDFEEVKTLIDNHLNLN